MTAISWRHWLLVAIPVIALAGFWIAGPIPQPPGYHLFADARTCLGVPNAANVPKEMMTPGGFGIPFHLTPFGIMYNPERVPEPKSWTDLWDPKYKGRVSMWDAYYDAYIMAAVATGKGDDVEAGIKAWEPHRANIGAWTSSVPGEQDMVSRGEVWFAPHWGACGPPDLLPSQQPTEEA